MKVKEYKIGTSNVKMQDREREEKNGLARGYKAITIKDGKMLELVDMRLAVSSSGTWYACIWCKGDEWNSGSGRASGNGYHKASAAAAYAIRAAGIQLDEDIDGRGWTAVETAIKVIGEYLSGGEVFVVEMYA